MDWSGKMVAISGFRPIRARTVSIRHEPAALTFMPSLAGCPDRARERIGFTIGRTLKEELHRLTEWCASHKTGAEAECQTAKAG